MRKSVFVGTVNKVKFTEKFTMLEITVSSPKEVENRVFTFVLDDGQCSHDFHSLEIPVGTLIKVTHFLDLSTLEMEQLRAFIVLEIVSKAYLMVEKYLNTTGEIAFRLWMFANAIEVLKAAPNEEKAKNLKSKMEAFSSVVAEKGTEENVADLKALIAEI